jgi:hypothetical protein
MSLLSSILFNRIKKHGYILLSLALILLFFYPVIFTDKTFFFRDIHRWFYPMKSFLASSFQNAEIPYWCPNYFCGSPFISDLQSGVFYPLSLIFLLSPFYKAFNYFILSHFILGFCFFYLFIKELGQSRKAAIFTGISYCFGGYTIACVNTLNNLSTVIWLPAILWSFTMALKRQQPHGYFLTVFFLCMAILGGEPQLTIIMMVLLLVYGLICIPAKNNWKEQTRIAIIIFILIASALMITMAQLGPTYIDYKLSARMGGFSYDEATKYSLNPVMLKHFFIPLLFPDNFTTDPNAYKYLIPNNVVLPWLLTVYPGFLIMPLAILGIFSYLSRKNLFWLFILVLAIAFALGNNSPIYRIFYKIFPFFRFPEKFMFLASFSLLILAGYGTDTLFSLLHKLNIRSSIVFTLISIILVIDLFITHKNLNPSYESDFYQKYHPYLKVILNDHDTFRVYNSNPEISDNSTNESILNHHQRWQSFLMPNLGILHHLDHIDGRAGLELRYQYIITEILEKSWSEKISFLRLANVKYIISPDDLSKNPEISDRLEKINPIVFKIKDYLPRAWMVKQLRPIEKGTVDELLEDNFDPLHSAIAKGEIISRYDHPSFTGIDNISYERNNKIHIDVTTETPGILVLSESSYPGWQVFVDGKERECLWLNLLFQGVEVEEGSHQIDFTYHPKNFNLFLSISMISVTLFLLIWLCYTQFGRKPQ